MSCGGVTTGLMKEENKNSISIYPNPFNANFTLQISSETIFKNAIIKIYDVCGKEVKTISIKGNETNIDRGELKNGIYFHDIFRNNETIGKRQITTYNINLKMKQSLKIT